MPRQAELKQNNIIQVVALVLENSQGDLFITQRQQDQHLAGFWEFPGGKVEKNETLHEALNREIHEELAYLPHKPVHLLTVEHQYPEKKVRIDFYHCIDDEAKPQSMEGQAMRWVNKKDINKIQLPPANLKIVKLLQQTK